MRHVFKIPIGDWSGDGHNACDYFFVSAAKDAADIIDAFQHARNDMPDYDPKEVCNSPDEYEPAAHIQAIMIQQGIMLGSTDDGYDFGTQELAAYVCWFANQGDPELDLRLEPVLNNLPLLQTLATGYGLLMP